MAKRKIVNGHNSVVGTLAHLYNSNPIRTAKNNEGEEVWVVTDVISAVTESKNPQNYWYKTRARMKDEGCEWVTNCHILKIKAADGKYYHTQVMTIPQILRMLQSLPSKKAEPFKKWMADAGYAIIKETLNPDLAIERGYEGYIKRGMTPRQAMARAKSVIVRNNLTAQWEQHGLRSPREYALLTDREYKNTFGKTAKQMKQERLLPDWASLRDAMTLPELTVAMVTETTVSLLIDKNDPQGYIENVRQVDTGSQVGRRLMADMLRVLSE